MDELVLPPIERILELRKSGLTWREVGQEVNLPAIVCQRMLDDRTAQWPKLVTRIEPDGTIWSVRYP